MTAEPFLKNIFHFKIKQMNQAFLNAISLPNTKVLEDIVKE